MRSALIICIFLIGCSPISELVTVNAKVRKSRECDPSRDLVATVNGTPYACSVEGKWVINQDAVKREAEEREHRHKLYWALRTRVLTDAEMKEVEQYDYNLIIEPMQPFFEAEKKAEFNAAILQQFKLRVAANAK